MFLWWFDTALNVGTNVNYLFFLQISYTYFYNLDVNQSKVKLFEQKTAVPNNICAYNAIL